VVDWAGVRRLHEREGLSKATIARRFRLSRNPIARLLTLSEPPQYVRPPRGSILDPSTGAIAALLDVDPKAPATVIREHLRARSIEGSPR
jgi:hypothetical protein